MAEQDTPVFIVVAGPAGAGKTAFIRTLSDRPAAGGPLPASAVERVVEGYRLNYDYGQIHVDDSLTVRLLAPPAATQVQLARHLPQDTLGVILVISSQDQAGFPTARTMIAEYQTFAGVPLVIAATMQDLPGALPPDDLRACLDIPPNVLLLPCVAIDPDSVNSVVIRLLHILIDRLEAEAKANAPGPD